MSGMKINELEKLKKESPDLSNAKTQIFQLVQNYVNNKDKLKKDSETDTRVKFIDRMFEALGWDVFGTKIPDEVQREESIKTKESGKKKADYTFKLNGITKFIVEAKAFGEDLDNPVYTKQAVNYAFNKVCSWAVLTNFIKIYILYVNRKGHTSFYKIDLSDIKNFNSEFATLWFLSKESIVNNLLDIEAKRRGLEIERIQIDQQLLNDLKRWREFLSNDIRKRYGDKYESYVIDEIVQRIIDRLIFIRKTEDGKLEEPKLDPIIRRYNENTYKEIKKVFTYYRDNYDSKLFEEDRKSFHECDKIELTNHVIEDVIRGINQVKDSDKEYDFSAIDADVLGRIYEQYLAYVLSQMPKTVKLKGGIAHRKEQGIYYTPTQIVNFIVRNTLGELLKTVKIKDINEVKVLDPACGSGSFLIKAFDVLNEYYIKNDESYQQTKLDLTGGITFTKKVEILKNNIFGVDLDPKAVEISQLNLLMKIAERGHRLPILQENIKCGNSIIDDPDIVGEDKAFIWEERFPKIVKNGFDVVIGNPPYGAELNEAERDYVEKKFEYSKQNKNTALIFIEKSLVLLSENGYFGMIVPKSLAFSQLWNPGRQLIKDYLVKVVDVSKAFEDVLLEQIIIILKKGKKSKYYKIDDLVSSISVDVDKDYIVSTDSIILHENKEDLRVFEKMNKNCNYLSKITKTSRGLPLQKYLSKQETKYPIIKGKNISRYHVLESNEYLPNDIISKNKSKVKFLMQPKIISQRIVAHITKPKDHIMIMSSLDKTGVLTVDTVENTIIIDKDYSLEFILCLLNSKIVSWYAYRYIFSKAIRTMDLDEYYLDKIPLPKVKIDNSVFKSLAEKMISTREKLTKLGTASTSEKDRLVEEINKIDKQIDHEIYDLYGLSEEEIKNIESS